MVLFLFLFSTKMLILPASLIPADDAVTRGYAAMVIIALDSPALDLTTKTAFQCERLVSIRMYFFLCISLIENRTSLSSLYHLRLSLVLRAVALARSQ
jgi:hypothetical protein